MKKLMFLLVLALLLALLVISREPSYVERIEECCGLDVSGSTLVSNADSHGGFHGDGALTVELDCAEISNAVLQQMENWNALPLSENLQLIMYGGSRAGVSYDYNLAAKNGIPEIDNGFYLFCDRHSDAVDSGDDSALFRSSYNFSLLIYDTDRARLYFFEFDT